MPFRPAAPLVSPQPLRIGVSLAAVVLCLLATLAHPARAQLPAPVPAAAASPPPAGAASAPGRVAASGSPRAAKAATSPLWSELTPPQQEALTPLASIWPAVSEAQKRKWLVISQSYAGLPPSEQAKLHSRMTDWVALSPQQRAQARLNFAVSKRLSPDDKKAKWEEYQALPPEQKRKLAAGAASAAKPPVTAAAVAPVPAQKLATVPRADSSKPPRTAGSPNKVDHNTLLPQPVQPLPAVPSN